MPTWLRRWVDCGIDWFARHYRLALCETYGEHIKVSQPWYLNISGPGIQIGNHCRIDPTPDGHVHLSCWPFHSDDTPAPRIELGPYCTLSPGVRLISAVSITCGHSCMFAGNVYVTDADWHGAYHRVFPPGQAEPVTLGNNVWLAEDVKVLKGVSIGDNTIIGAGAVVTESMPKNVVAAGNPARVVSHLDATAPMTDRKALFEQLDYRRFEAQFWDQRSQQNSLWRWLMGILWPATRHTSAPHKTPPTPTRQEHNHE